VSLHLLDDKLLINTDINKPDNVDFQPSIGFEYGLSEIVSFRAGCNNANEDNISVNLGLGIKMDRWVLDYAYVPYGKLGDAHRISLSARFGDVPLAKSSNELLYEKRMLQNKQKELDRIMMELQKERRSLNKKRVTVKSEKPVKKKKPVKTVKNKKSVKDEQAKIIKTLQKEHEINVRKKRSKMIISLSGTVFGFRLGSDEIEQDYRDKLHEIAGLIRSVPGCKVEIIGHADDSGDSKDNYELSLRRAKSVLNYFVKIEKIPESRLTAIGYGSTKPIVTDGKDMVEQRIRNRRVEVVITK
jgi:chemotaxis protein MotB